MISIVIHHATNACRLISPAPRVLTYKWPTNLYNKPVQAVYFLHYINDAWGSWQLQTEIDKESVDYWLK